MKKYSYEEVLLATNKYFNGDELAADVWVNKYCLRDNEGNILEKTPEDMHRRMAREFARIEKAKFKEPLSEDTIFKLFDKFRYIVPQGSPMYGIGNDYQTISLSNCYVLDVPEDSYGDIMRVDEQLVQISKRRGGVGIDISKLRPEGEVVHNSSRTTSGIIPFMERYSNSIREVGQNARRGALMITLSVHHPQILDFINIKKDLTKVTGANISVKLTDEFLKAVEANEKYELRWPVNSKNPKYSVMCDAKAIWDAIIHSAWQMAEPGLLFWDNILKYTPADCYPQYRSVATNPCSELNMPSLDSCRLLLLNMYSYVVNPFTIAAYFDYKLFYEHSQLAQRLMDDMVDLESEKIDRIIEKIDKDPEPEYCKQRERDMWVRIKKICVEGRRTGTGITGLGDTIAALGMYYASNDSIKFTDKVYNTLKFGCYRSSIDMAKELGPFQGWDSSLEKDCEYLNRIKNESIEYGTTVVDGNRTAEYLWGQDIYNDMQKYGRRNVALTTTAPAGSVSILTQTTSGIEPLFMMSYKRRKKINHAEENTRVDFIDKTGDKWQEFEVHHPKVAEWMRITGETDLKESPWYKKCAEDIDWQKRVELQAVAGKHICHSISSTINLPENVSRDEVAKVYEEAWKLGIKGLTVYRKNCRSGVLIENKAEKNDAAKRPKQVSCKIHYTSIDKKMYIVLVGYLKEGEPYEVFVLPPVGKQKDKKCLDTKEEDGIIKKVKRGVYELQSSEGEQICENIAVECTPEIESLARLTSLSLRHGVETEYVVSQLEKVSGNMLCPAKSIARVLKKYIKDGTQSTGDNCPNCRGKYKREGGCKTCIDCGYSLCQ